MRRSTAVAGALAAGVTILLTGPAAQAAETEVLKAPGDFIGILSDTRATGHYEVRGTALHIWTEGKTSTDKVAEYVSADDVPLSGVGEPSLDYTPISGTIPPGFQLVVDFDADGSGDGILVGEPGSYGTDWWVNKAAKTFVKAAAPETGGGSGSDWYGTPDEWRTAFPRAEVKAFGFSLGSGVEGEGLLEAIEFDGTRYTFGRGGRLNSGQMCQDGGWALSFQPTFRNQGQCVAHFAKAAER